ncbi:hypothetical protein QBC47DRAFT_349587 [Echria macrotheca]|uniref:DOMON domain-containing protein n=1 Tax=Echria macrotheca TaxID=438768 RepID=A0AAJ0B6S3_9PEZI|nr:hypothetical protein QBC47DRAFT_349587 [Echria macrotheca]
MLSSIATLLPSFFLATTVASPISHDSHHRLQERGTWGESRYCKPNNGLCYLQLTPTGFPNIPTYRIAIPDSASSSSAFDAILETVTPVALGWTGWAWGGTMLNNPLTVVWPNGNSATATVRWATGKTLPQPYSGATFKLLSSSKNSTHWTAEVACTGCTRWGSSGQIRPDSTNSFSWAVGDRGSVSNPSSSSSSFKEHINNGALSTGALTKYGKNTASAFQAHYSSGKGT